MSSLQTLFYTFAKVFFSSSHFGSCFWNWLFTHFIFDPSLSFLRHSRVSLNRPCPRLLHFMGPSFQGSPYRKTTERIRSRAEIQEKTQSQPGLFFSVKQAHLMMNIHSGAPSNSDGSELNRAWSSLHLSRCLLISATPLLVGGANRIVFAREPVLGAPAVVVYGRHK